MQKQEIVAQLQHIERTYTLSVMAMGVFQDSRIGDLLKGKTTYLVREFLESDEGQVRVEGFKMGLEQMGQTILDGGAKQQQALDEFGKAALRTLIKDSFECIKGYSEETGQAPSFRAQDWYQFARMVRNSLSHDYCFRFNTHDRTLLPVTWRDRTISVSMDNLPMELSLLDHGRSFALFSAIRAFAVDDLA